jgi:hypothetical protein
VLSAITSSASTGAAVSGSCLTVCTHVHSRRLPTQSQPKAVQAVLRQQLDHCVYAVYAVDAVCPCALAADQTDTDNTTCQLPAQYLQLQRISGPEPGLLTSHSKPGNCWC